MVPGRSSYLGVEMMATALSTSLKAKGLSTGGVREWILTAWCRWRCSPVAVLLLWLGGEGRKRGRDAPARRCRRRARDHRTGGDTTPVRTSASGSPACSSLIACGYGQTRRIPRRRVWLGPPKATFRGGQVLAWASAWSCSSSRSPSSADAWASASSPPRGAGGQRVVLTRFVSSRISHERPLGP